MAGGRVLLLAHGAEVAVPPRPGALTWLTSWELRPVPDALLLLAAIGYLLAARSLRSRGDAWPVGRTVAFLGPGLGAVLVATSSSLAVYDQALLWVHMVQHMVLSMVAPIFLALGAPVTLALRVARRPVHRRLLAVLHSRPARVLTFAPLAGILFVATPFVLYFSRLYDETLRHPLLHDLNHVHLLLVGCLWFWGILGVDPIPGRLPHGLRLVAVFATLPFHAILGVTIMGSPRLLAPDWYAALGRTWGPTLAEDQRLAGGLLWASGDLIGLLIFGVLFVQWMRASEREAAREDRRLDALEAALAAQAPTAPPAPPEVPSSPAATGDLPSQAATGDLPSQAATGDVPSSRAPAADAARSPDPGGAASRR